MVPNNETTKKLIQNQAKHPGESNSEETVEEWMPCGEQPHEACQEEIVALQVPEATSTREEVRMRF